MSEETALVNVEGTAPAKWNPDFLNDVSQGTFNRIQLYGSSSTPVKKGELEVGFYYIEGDKTEALGKSFDAIVLAWRPTAMQIIGDDVKFTHDDKSELFAKIKELQASKDQEIRKGNMWGPEFLLWLPSKETFVPYFLGNASARYVTNGFVNKLGKSATIVCQFVEKGDYSWHAPKITDCENPIDVIPEDEAVKEAINTFNNPQEQAEQATVEAATPAPDTGGRAV